MSTVEVKAPPEFSKYISVEYEEFDVKAFFEEIMPFVRTPHRCYRIEDENHESTLELLIGVTHPVLFRIKAERKMIRELEQKLRVYGFKKAKWEWK